LNLKKWWTGTIILWYILLNRKNGRIDG